MGVTPNPLFVDNLILSSNTNATSGFNPVGLNNILSDALSLSQSGSQTVTSPLILSSTLNVTGLTSLTTLNVSGSVGALSLSSTLAVTGATTLSTTLGVTGASTLTSATLSGTLTANGAHVAKVTVLTASATYAVVATDRYVVVNQTSGAPITITMPTAPTTGRLLSIKDGKGDSGTGNTITITATQNIDGIAGATGVQINNNYGSIDFVYNGTAWNIL